METGPQEAADSPLPITAVCVSLVRSSIPGREATGPKRTKPQVTSALPLTLKDLEGIAPAKTGVVDKMRDSHHQLARLLAEGQKVVDISFTTGYSAVHISRLQGDPAFQELVNHYRDVVEVKYVNVHERISALAVDTVQEIHERLREQPDDFTVAGLTELAKLTLDRSGFGPTKTVNSTSVTAQVTPDDLARIRAQRTQGSVKQIGKEKIQAPLAAPSNRAVELPVIDFSPSDNPQVTLEGLESRGDKVREEIRQEDAGGVREGPSSPGSVGQLP